MVVGRLAGSRVFYAIAIDFNSQLPRRHMFPHPPLELPADRPVLLLDIDGVINVFQCATARETQIAPYLPALKLLPGLADWLARLDQVYALIWCSHWGALVNID